jgi:hypothetical protein
MGDFEECARVKRGDQGKRVRKRGLTDYAENKTKYVPFG